jgi:hypothetical protein
MNDLKIPSRSAAKLIPFAQTQKIKRIIVQIDAIIVGLSLS